MKAQDLQNFKTELKALLGKYNVSIDYCASPCSDFHGISDERISVMTDDNKEHRLADQSYIDATDLS